MVEIHPFTAFPKYFSLSCASGLIVNGPYTEFLTANESTKNLKTLFINHILLI